METKVGQTICWKHIWNSTLEGIGLEHLLLKENTADGIILATDKVQGNFRLAYRLGWDTEWQLQNAEIGVVTERSSHTIGLLTDGEGRWSDSSGRRLTELDGCCDIDIWPTPFTNSFPIRRRPLAVGEQQEFRMAWVSVIDPTIRQEPQRYTRLSERLYLFESLDGSGFKVELQVDEDNIVRDYPGFFRRL